MRLFLAISLLLKVVKKNSQGPSLLAKISNDRTTGPHSLLHLTLGIQLGQSTPSTQILTAVHHNHGDFTLGAESTNELFVLLVFAVLGEAAETGGAAVECLGAFVESFAESVVDECLFEYL